MISYEEHLRLSVVSRETLDQFLDDNTPTWARFDSEVGYTLGNYIPRDGMEASSTISTSQANGQRTAQMYADVPGRINTYGNSFTQCHQVSDGETWQEYLSAHFGEPVRNFGMGGFGSYQAYRRMIRTEQSDDAAKYIIFYIWGDDHIRSCLRCRHVVIRQWRGDDGGHMFHGNFWANIEMDLDSGELVEHQSLCPTPRELYNMTDPDFMVEKLRDDLMLQLAVADSVDPTTLDIPRLNALADILGATHLDETDADSIVASANALQWTYGFAATRYIIRKVVSFCQAEGKEVLFTLLCPTATRQLLQGQERHDQTIADFLRQENLRYFDMNEVHRADYQAFNLSVDDYLKRYYIGHYNPSGNHFFAYSIRKPLLEMLDPKPITYRDASQRVIDFKGYLPDA